MAFTAPPPEIKPPAIPRVTCPCCDAAPGVNKVALETRRVTDRSALSGKTTYLVTTVQVPGVCDVCAKSLRKKRYLADLLCLVPFVIFVVLGAAFESKLAALGLFFYLLYMIRWLTYNWADAVLYGWDLAGKLDSYAPPEDPGPRRFPAGTLHGAIRVGFFPALVLLLIVLTVSGAFGEIGKKSRSADGKTSAVAPGSARSGVDPVPLEQAFVYFSAAKSIAWPGHLAHGFVAVDPK
ncbi:MAG: hypothetical protein EXS37_11390 [Opitutus sp.]|nr:hypothetical protein [Opitutus sp.]